MNYARLQTLLQDYLQTTETTFLADLGDIVKQAEDRIYKQVVLPVNRKTTTLAYTNGVNLMALPTDFLAPFELRSVVSGTYSPVYYVDVSYILEAYPVTTVTGVPNIYSIYDDQNLIVGPTPNGTVTGYLHYFYKPASIVDAGSSWLGTNAENCLLFGCLSEAYTFLKGDMELQKEYEDKFQMALKDLKALGQGSDLGDSYRMGESRVPRQAP